MAFPLDQTVSFTGQENLSGDDRKLFQTLFAGEVLTEFRASNIMMDKHRVRTIKNGKSADFPMIGTAKASYHTPGQEIQGQQIAGAKRTITVDGLAISPVFIDKLDEAMIHYEVRSAYSKECGESLGELVDRNILRTAVKSARIVDATTCTAAGITPLNGETFTSNVTMGAAGDELKGDKIVEAIFKAVTEFATKNINTNDMAIYLPPAQYYALFNATDTTKLTWMNKDVGGVGNMSTGKIPMIAGLPIHMTTHLPQTDQSATLGDDDPAWQGDAAKYKGNYSKVVGLVMGRNAVATVKIFDMATEMEYQISRQGWLFVAKYAMGHNILRPAEAILIEKA